MENAIGMEYDITEKSRTGKRLEGETKKEAHYHEILLIISEFLQTLGNKMQVQELMFKEKHYQYPRELNNILNLGRQLMGSGANIYRQAEKIRLSKSIDLRDTPIYSASTFFKKQ